jgi:hypothetical protein
MLELLIKSCPKAVGIPNDGEYPEPPLVMELKASLYVGGADNANWILYQRVKQRIYETVHCMLANYPQSASRFLSGARDHNTALHSAVFHGRCSQTIHLLLQAEQQGCTTSRAALFANTQGELPLHQWRRQWRSRRQRWCQGRRWLQGRHQRPCTAPSFTAIAHRLSISCYKQNSRAVPHHEQHCSEKGCTEALEGVADQLTKPRWQSGVRTSCFFDYPILL